MPRMLIAGLLSALLVCSLAATAQAQTSWGNSFGLTYERLRNQFNTEDGGASLAPTSDGGYIVAGFTTYNLLQGGGPWVLKLDAAGQVQWQNLYQSGNLDRFLGVSPTPDGGYLLAGHTISFGTGDNDLWIMKLDASGGIIWQKTLGGHGWDTARAVAVAADGGYLAAGYTESFGSGQEGTTDAWLVKFSPSGDVQWQKTYGDSGLGSAAAWAVQPTGDGGFVAAGGWVSVGTETAHAWLFKVDASGNLLWQKALGHTASLTDFHFRALASDGQGGWVAAGQVSNQDNGQAAFLLARYDGEGNLNWQKALNRNSSGDQARALVHSGDGNLVVAGDNKSAVGPILTAKLNPAGDIIWQRSWDGGASAVTALAADPDRGTALTGTVSDAQGATDLVVLKQDTAGALNSACPAGSMSSMHAFSPQELMGVLIDTNATVEDSRAGAVASGAVKTTTNAAGCGQ